MGVVFHYALRWSDATFLGMLAECPAVTARKKKKKGMGATDEAGHMRRVSAKKYVRDNAFDMKM